MANDRISQEPVEILVTPTSGTGRTSQEPVEVVLSPTSGKARSSQELVEVVVIPTSGRGRTSQLVVEVLITNVPIQATATDSLSAVSESASRSVTYGRTTADSISSLSESVSGVVILGRTVADSLSAITETVSRVATYARTVSDSISSIGESVVAIAGLITRTIDDSLSSISDAVIRTGTGNRTATDSLATLTETVSRVSTYARTVADSLPAISESVAAVLTTIIRSISDSIASLTETVSQTHTFARTVADSISSISTSVSRVVSLLRSVADLVPIVNQRVAVVTPYVPIGPFDPGGAGVFDLTIDAVSVLTNSVVIESMRFESQVNGTAGQCQFRIRDDTGTESYTVGQEIVLTIAGRTEWRGFVANVKRVYAFAAFNVDEFGPTRFIDIEGTDVNVLFNKRIVFDQSTPTNIYAPLLAPHTADVTAIQQLFADWLDLSGDGLDTTTYVDNVADTTWTQEGRAWEGSDTWGQAMQSIASLPAAIYYIDPDRNFIYTDVDTPNAPFQLSDQPNHVTSFGYREMEIIMDGTNLANDVMCWGAGYGSQVPVFIRDESTSSQATHGLWQLGQTTFGVFLQSTIDRIADSILNGSPQSKRGAKDDRPAIQVVTHQGGLRVADKVDFTSAVFGYEDVIPIRKMVIEFEGPATPKYTLTLSHEIDTPFNFFDPFLIDWHLPKVTTCPPGYIMGPSGCIPIPIPQTGGCTDAVCGITDTFTRVVGGGWGTSDAGLVWQNNFGTSQSVNGTRGVLPEGTAVFIDSLTNPNSDYRFTFEFASAVGVILAVASLDSSVEFWNDINQIDVNRESGSSHTDSTSFTFAVGVIYHAHIVDNNTSTAVTVWADGDPEPGTPTLVNTTVTYPPGDNTSSPGFQAVIGTSYYDNLDIPGFNRCTAVQFDDFSRTVSGNWGTATPASAFSWTNIQVQGSIAVSGGSGLMNVDHAGASRVISVRTNADASAPWLHTDGFTLTEHFVMFGAPSLAKHTTGVGIIAGGPTGGTGSMFIFYDGSDNSINDQDGNTAILPYTLTSGAWWFLKFEITWNANAGSKTWSAKMWPEDIAEPSTPQIIGSGGTAYVGAGYVLFTNFQNFNNGVANLLGEVDYIDFDYTGKPCYRDCVSPAFFVIGGGKSELGKSADGTNWSLTRSGGSAGDAWRGITWSPDLDLIVAVGGLGTEIARSTDGVSWTTGTTGVAGPPIWRAIAWSPGLHLFVAVGGSGLSGDPGHIVTSPNGTTWTARTSPFTASFSLPNCVAWSPQLALFVAGADSAQVATSSNGTTWTLGTSGFTSSDRILAVAWSVDLGRFVMASTSAIRYSTNGTTWTAAASGVSNVTSLAWSHDLGLFVAGRTIGGTASKIATSPDGSTWTLQTTPFGTNQVAAVAWSDGLNLFIAGGGSGTTPALATSPDGTTWTLQTTGFGTTTITSAVAFGALCTPVPPGAGITSNSWVCEQFDGSAALVTLGNPFLQNSPQVWINGLLVNQSTYTQDPTAGTITLASPPGPSGTVRVCYWSF